MAYLRRIELKLSASGIKRTAEEVMDDMQHPATENFFFIALGQKTCKKLQANNLKEL